MNFIFALKEVYQKFGWKKIIRMLFYPVTVIFTTPIRLVQTLWQSRILLDGKDWQYYQHFKARISLTSLFYSTRALNLSRYGRSGKSPTLALGNYSLARCFHYSLFSLYAYWKAGAVTVLMSMTGWWILHLFWVDTSNIGFVLITMVSLLISTTFYANAFGIQNYNSIGWIFSPIILFGIINNNWLIAGFALFLASFGSFTVVFLMNIIIIVSAVYASSYIPLFALLPANLKLLFHFYPFLLKENKASILIGVLKAIGFIDTKVKYKRSISKKFDLRSFYYALLYLQFLYVVYYLTGEVSIIFLTGLILFFINTVFLRFADQQSMQMLLFTVAVAVTLYLNNYFLLISLWFLISPLPALAFSFRLENFLDIVPKLKPFSLKNILNGLENFLSPVNLNEKILMAFDNPNNIYEKIFDDYRTIYEAPLYIAAKRDIHLLPDWWAVFELNYENAPEIWGRDVESVKKNIKQWKADYVIIYQKAGTEIDAQWQNSGFEILNKFSWADYEHEFDHNKPFKSATPDWWLLKKPRFL